MGDGPGVPGPRVVALFGPTGSGKTEVAIELAELLAEDDHGAVAINCDSMQVYEGMETLTGAPDPVQRERLEHRLVSFVPPEREFSAGEFGALARAEIDSVLTRGEWPILVGGTGLYMRSALTDLEMRPQIPQQVAEAIEREIDQRGPRELHRRLPAEHASWVEPTDRKRIARFLGLIAIGETPAPPSSKGGSLWDAPMRHPTLAVGLTLDREVLRGRIEARVEKMAAGGATEEARTLLDSGPSLTAGKAIGLAEFAAGDLEAAARGHLELARRQITWLKRMEGLLAIDRTELDDRGVARIIFGQLSADQGRDA